MLVSILDLASPVTFDDYDVIEVFFYKFDPAQYGNLFQILGS